MCVCVCASQQDSEGGPPPYVLQGDLTMYSLVPPHALSCIRPCVCPFAQLCVCVCANPQESLFRRGKLKKHKRIRAAIHKVSPLAASCAPVVFDIVIVCVCACVRA